MDINDIRKRRALINRQISKGFNDNFDQENISKAYDDEFNKAHKVGDIHPNGKWIWTEIKPGKFDWRVIGGRRNKKSASAGGSSSDSNAKTQSSGSKPSPTKKTATAAPVKTTAKPSSKVRDTVKDAWGIKTYTLKDAWGIIKNAHWGGIVGATPIAILPDDKNDASSVKVILQTSAGKYRCYENIEIANGKIDKQNAYPSPNYKTIREAMNYAETGRGNARYRYKSRQIPDSAWYAPKGGTFDKEYLSKQK